MKEERNTIITSQRVTSLVRSIRIQNLQLYHPEHPMFSELSKYLSKRSRYSNVFSTRWGCFKFGAIRSTKKKIREILRKFCWTKIRKSLASSFWKFNQYWSQVIIKRKRSSLVLLLKIPPVLKTGVETFRKTFFSAKWAWSFFIKVYKNFLKLF